MTFIPMSLSRAGHRSLLKLRAGSPTILIVSGIAGFAVTAVLAGKASRKVDPIMDAHKQARGDIGYIGNNRDRQKQVTLLYVNTGWELTKLYGPTLLMGTSSAMAVFGGHTILKRRHIATMAAYSGLLEQFKAYRGRVAKTLGEDVEKGIYEGAHGEWEDDPDNPGEQKLVPKFDGVTPLYLRPWFNQDNPNWSTDPENSYAFLRAVQAHMNRILQIKGHVFLNDVLDALRMNRVPEGQAAGWLRNNPDGDNYVDFGFMHSIDPNSMAFKNGDAKSVQLNFNIDGVIWDKI